MNQDQMLLEVKNLKTYFFLEEGTVHAIDGADFHIARGEALGVVGESGCGNSVTLGARFISAGATCSSCRSARCARCAATAFRWCFRSP